MAFLRFNRDTRGYEHFSLVQQTTNRRGKVRPRLLYWFRTPPNVKVGRQPFDDAVRRALEAQNPDIYFDWQAILDTPIPPPAEAERWRERRRFERAARQAAAEETQDVASEPESTDEREVPPPPSAANGLLETAMSDTPEVPGEPRADVMQSGPLDTLRRRRRRRRGRRGSPVVAGTADGIAAPESSTQPQIEPDEPSNPEEGE
jgi:hypothetical protein